MRSLGPGKTSKQRQSVLLRQIINPGYAMIPTATCLLHLPQTFEQVRPQGLQVIIKDIPGHSPSSAINACHVGSIEVVSEAALYPKVHLLIQALHKALQDSQPDGILIIWKHLPEPSPTGRHLCINRKEAVSTLVRSSPDRDILNDRVDTSSFIFKEFKQFAKQLLCPRGTHPGMKPGPSQQPINLAIVCRHQLISKFRGLKVSLFAVT